MSSVENCVLTRRAMSAVKILLACAAILQGVLTAEWTYTGPLGSDQWATSFPTCGKDRQSPINIFEGDVRIDTRIGPFKFNNYDTISGLQMTLRNNGHSATIALSGLTAVTVEGGGLPAGTFRAFQFHFHWGDVDELGSEHLLSSTAYPMELHIVYFNTKYVNPAVALNKEDGLTVLGFFYEVSEEDNINYNGIINKLPFIQQSGSEIDIPPVALKALLPATFSKFFRYPGSLTTPSCQESVTWTIFKEPIRLSEYQLEAFRQLLDSHGGPLVNNFRPVQPLNNRYVTSNFKPDIQWSYKEGLVNADTWGLYYSGCSGNSQSPVNIPTLGSRLDTRLQDINFHNYDSIASRSFKLINNGHTADVDITAGNLSISGGGLPDEYRASRLHFHWGSSDMAGSEHTLDNVAYPMELQIVHYQKSLGKLAKAIVQPDGLAVLGFFFEISATDNRALNTLIKYLQAIQHPGTSIGLPPFSLNSILPTNKANFFRYTGSLTVPGCFQSVIWTVFSDTIKISASQLAAFRLLKSSVRDEDGSILTMVDNYRPVQNLNQRVVTRNFIAPLEHRPSTDLLKILREYYRTYKSRTSEEDQ